MEIIIILVVLGVALYWFAFRKKPSDTFETSAPYKVEAPAVETKSAPAVPVVTEVVAKPAKTKKPAAEKKTAPKAKKTTKKAKAAE